MQVLYLPKSRKIALILDCFIILLSFYIIVNRPRPPTNLIYRPKNASDFKLVYGFSFNPPEEYIIDESFSGSFRVRTYTHREREPNGRVCTGSNIKTGESHREGGIDLPVQEYASNSLLYTVRMEVALLVDGVMSEFVALRLRSDNRSSCDVPIDIGEHAYCSLFHC